MKTSHTTALVEVEKRLREQIAALRDDELDALIAATEQAKLPVIESKENADGSFGKSEGTHTRAESGNDPEVPEE